MKVTHNTPPKIRTDSSERDTNTRKKELTANEYILTHLNLSDSEECGGILDYLQTDKKDKIPPRLLPIINEYENKLRQENNSTFSMFSGDRPSDASKQKLKQSLICYYSKHNRAQNIANIYYYVKHEFIRFSQKPQITPEDIDYTLFILVKQFLEEPDHRKNKLPKNLWYLIKDQNEEVRDKIHQIGTLKFREENVYIEKPNTNEKPKNAFIESRLKKIEDDNDKIFEL